MTKEEINVLMIGNNPLELTKVFDFLMKVPSKSVNTEIAFDLKSVKALLAKFSPNYILIDDNMGRLELANVVNLFARFKKTRNVPITILKNSNYEEAFGGVAMNYILKENLSVELLFTTLKNSFVSSRAQRYLKNIYKKRRGQRFRILSTAS